MVQAVPLRRPVATSRVLALRDGNRSVRSDRLAAEEPMEIRAGGPGQEPVRVAVTMRTPGDDFDLAVGFLFSEGLVRGSHDVATVAYCDDLDEEEQRYNVVTVRLRRPVDGAALQRNFFTTSSCGICGKASLEQVEVRCAPVPPGPHVRASTILGLPEALREVQRVFEATGGLHAAGLFTAEGEALVVREDVGRHNALDKVIGWSVLRGQVPLSGRVVLVSGRASFELVQKAAVAGVPVLCAVSAPSSLAVEAAERLGLTVVGFVRGRSLNVYSHPERVDLGA
jgi:FdhD protein